MVMGGERRERIVRGVCFDMYPLLDLKQIANRTYCTAQELSHYSVIT